MLRIDSVQAGSKGSGIRLTWVNWILLAIGTLLFVGTMLLVQRSLLISRQLQGDSDKYMTCQQDAVLLEEASDYLTEQAHFFAQTGETGHVFNYAREVLQTRRRDRIQQDALEFELEEDVLYYLNRALEHSNALVLEECRAMRLILEAKGLDTAEFPALVGGAVLTAEEAALAAGDKLALAQTLLYWPDYQFKKSEIHRYVRKSLDVLASDTRVRQERAMAQLQRVRQYTWVLLLLLLLLALLYVFIHRRMVFAPLRESVRRVGSREAMPVQGCREVRSLAQTYNAVLAENISRTAALSYSASHDGLTGLYNRAAYEEAYRAADREHVTMLILDVDQFKDFNDRFGHDVGDLVLKRVAQELQNAFRRNDHVSRIGGDEFCVIMQNTTSTLSELVQAKVKAIFRALARREGKTPPITLSVGIAFGDRQTEAGLFKDADNALYKVKETGRGGYWIA